MKEDYSGSNLWPGEMASWVKCPLGKHKELKSDAQHSQGIEAEASPGLSGQPGQSRVLQVQWETLFQKHMILCYVSS